jgi:hypothetical protein
VPPLSRSTIGFEDQARHQSRTHFRAEIYTKSFVWPRARCVRGVGRRLLAIPRIQPDCLIAVRVDLVHAQRLVVDSALTPYGHD